MPSLTASGAAARPSRRPIRRVDLVQEVSARLEREITDGRYPSGTVLPSQGEVAQQFGVSRTVVREAMRVLCSRGLLEVSQGRGARVREATGETVVRSLGTYVERHGDSALALMEVRLPLEVECAALAAERATPEDIEALRDCQRRLNESNTVEHQIAADVEFHRRVAESTGNSLFVLMQQALTQSMEQHLRWALNRLGLRRPERSHPPIVEAIKRHDAEAARQAMTLHMRRAVAAVRKAETLPPEEIEAP